MEKKYKLIFDTLEKMHENAVCELNYDTDFHLLVAVILSAQCTDARVNKITPKLFEKYKTPEDMASADIDELKELIKSCGFYNAKANSIISASRDIVEKYNSRLPENVDELMKLKGVGRKTANVVYSVAFKGNAIAVDTHVLRVSYRLGLSSQNKNPLITEKDLNAKFDENLWGKIHHLLIHHGRYICKARKPDCEICELKNQCKYFNGELKSE